VSETEEIMLFQPKQQPFLSVPSFLLRSYVGRSKESFATADVSLKLDTLIIWSVSLG